MADIKNMTTKQKVSYIWYYYKIHIFVAVFVLIIGVVTINQFVTRKDYVFNFSLMGDNFNKDNKDKFQNAADKLIIGGTNKKKGVLVDYYPLIQSADGKVTMEQQYNQKMAALISVGEIDVIEIDKRMFKDFADRGVFLRLDDIKELKLPKSGLENDSFKDSSGQIQSGVYGIDMGNNNIIKSIDSSAQDKILCIMVSSKHTDMDVKFVNWILNGKIQ